MNILEEFYFGNIDPNTQSFDSSSSYGQAIQVIADREEKFSALLEGKEKMVTGKLADHCESIETLAFQLSEQIHHFYISQHSLPEDDFWTRASAYSAAQMIADEVVCHKLIYV